MFGTPASWMLVVAAGLCAIALASVFMLYASWPDGSSRAGTDTRLFFIGLAAGSLGGAVHSLSVLGNLLGNRYLVASWVPWFFLQPLVGSALALILVLSLRGGLLSATASSSDLNSFGVAAMSALVGLFSSQATRKLQNIFKGLRRIPGGPKPPGESRESDY